MKSDNFQNFTQQLGLKAATPELRAAYRVERSRSQIALAIWGAPVLALALCGYVWVDVRLTGVPLAAPFRIPSIMLAIALSLGCIFKFRQNIRGFFPLYLMAFGSLIVMIYCILFVYLIRAPERYEPGMTGLTVVIFATFMAQLGNWRTYALLLGVPLLLFICTVVLYGIPASTLLSPMYNVIALMVAIIAVAEAMERLRQSSFYANQEARRERENSRRLLDLILPKSIAKDLLDKGDSPPLYIPQATVMFTDFVNFTGSALNIKPAELVEKLNRVFLEIDAICMEFGIEKIKTIGDAYMVAGGVPVPHEKHAINICTAALKILERIRSLRTEEAIPWFIRIGIHTGPVMAGIVGRTRFTYDLWGDTVNVASRLEGASEPDTITLSRTTRDLLGNEFQCDPHGSINARNRGTIEIFRLKEQSL